MPLKEYISNINQSYKSGIAREHSYRGDLQSLLRSMLSNVLITNEPARIDCGAPDFILTKNDIPLGYIEAKDIGEPLTGSKHKEQFTRYKESLPNIIFTDYLDFHFYRDGEFVTSVRIAEIAGTSIRPIKENEDKFQQLITDFATHSLQTIKSPSKLSKMMAAKARLLSNIIENALISDEQSAGSSDNTLADQLSAFQSVLIHDIDEKEFADIYAQTIAYGMFAARLHDRTLETFSRFEAARLIPKTNPFLRKLFQYIAGYDLDTRIDWIVDALADIFRATDVGTLLKDFGKATQQTDPIIHFYETFLSEFDPKLRKSRGVWYTPEPVVNFIVRAVDDILKDEFGLKDGLADTSKTKVKVKVPAHDKRYKEGLVEEEREVHKVQILDPAAGTGTFLAEVIKQIHRKFEGQHGIWPDYVENHLIPRLNGFEILMASYAMAHLKLDLLLKETGYDREGDQRFRIYLTNSLEEYHPDTGTLFAGWLSNEANEANHIKRDTPVMCVIGNPPYSGESANKGEWIMNLMEVYKMEPGGKEKLNERNPKWINDDYVKFLRYGQHFIEKNGSGVLAFINPHGYLDNPTFRGMRWHLLKTYDKIYTIDLHGNSKKKEVAPDGSADVNVFDIQQGVSVNIFVKTGNKKPNDLGKVYHYDLFGKRELKYDFLNENSIKSVRFEELPNVAPNFFFVQKDFESQKSYDKGFQVNELFSINNVGVVTSRDSFVIDDQKAVLQNRINDFFELTKEALYSRYKLKENKRWKIDEVKNQAKSYEIEHVETISYRLFDDRYIYYSDYFIERNRIEVMQHFLKGENVGLTLCKQFKTGDNYVHSFITKRVIESSYVSNRTSEITSVFPLYLYSEGKQQNLDGSPQRKPNLNPKIVKQIADGIDLNFTPEKEESEDTFAPIDLLDYIYAILHSPNYRETYKEFLKIDFPRVPYPENPETFWQLVKLGSELRKVHLLESEVVTDYITSYPMAGSNEVSRKITKNSPGFIPEDKNDQIGKVWINDQQYFGQVPLTAWEFYIGGYQPAQKWLKDRKGRTLSMEDIQHYQKIIVALMETDRIMDEVDDNLKL